MNSFMEYFEQPFGCFLQKISFPVISFSGVKLKKDTELCDLKAALDIFIKDLQNISQHLYKDINEQSSRMISDSDSEMDINVEYSKNLSGTHDDDLIIPEKTEHRIPTLCNSNLVQISASKSEIERRINAFIEAKRGEVDEENKREFCSAGLSEIKTGDSCARTDALFVPRAGGKSHVKISRVVNLYGPQTSIPMHSPRGKKRKEVNEITEKTSIEERLKNMESHLNMQSEGGTDQSKEEVYTRIKNLEERILFLESLSPEYFQQGIPAPKKHFERRREREQMTDMSITELDSRIKQLQDSLQRQGTKR